MNSNDFTMWLNGFVELNGGQQPTAEQWASIVEHLQLVFTKVTKINPKPDIEQRYCSTGNIQIENEVDYFLKGVTANINWKDIGPRKSC